MVGAVSHTAAEPCGGYPWMGTSPRVRRGFPSPQYPLQQMLEVSGSQVSPLGCYQMTIP